MCVDQRPQPAGAAQGQQGIQQLQREAPNMRQNFPARFWLEASVAAVGTLLFVLTLITREWFELLTGIDPDGSSGSVEFTLAAGLLVIAVASAFAARRSYRRMTA
jgi:hypothetical protein